MYKIFVVLVLFCLLSRSLVDAGSFSQSTPDHVKEIERVVKPIREAFAKRHGLHISGVGGAMMTAVESVTCWFESSDPRSIGEARKLHVELVNELLAAINRDEALRPHLKSYPFMPSNIKAKISYILPSGHWVAQGDGVAATISVNDTILYLQADRESDEIETRFTESFAEASSKVK